MQWIVEVDKKKCTGCGECVENCPGDVFQLTEGFSQPVNIEECHGCRTCESVCEFDAVTVHDSA